MMHPGQSSVQDPIGGRARHVQSVERAVAILEVIAQEGGAARLQAIADHCELKKSTAHNILATLEGLGYVQRRPVDAKYYLGERILNLARIVGDDASLKQRLRPSLESLSSQTGETVFLATPSGDQVLYLDGIEQGDEPRSWVGSRRPLGGSAVGLIFLAFTPSLYRRVASVRPDLFTDDFETEIAATRARGFALDLQKQREGRHCVAVPIFEGGVVRASFSLRAPSTRFNREMLNEAAWVMTRLAQEHPTQAGLLKSPPAHSELS